MTEQLDKEKLKTDAETARKFVLKMEEVIEDMGEEQINNIRKKLSDVFEQKKPKPSNCNS